MRRRQGLKLAVGKKLHHLLLHIHELRIIRLVATKIVHQQKAAAIKIVSEVFEITRKKVEVTGFGHVEEGVQKQFFTIDVDELKRLRRGLHSGQTLKRGWKHRVAVRVVMMPWHLACLLQPPWLQVIAEEGILKTINVDFV